MSIAAAFLLISAVVLVAGAWYFSELLRTGALLPYRHGRRPGLEVVGLEGGRITLRVMPEAGRDRSWTTDGVWGLEWEGGYAQVGRILHIDDRQVVRELIALDGTPRVGERVQLDLYAYPDDPRRAFGLEFREVFFSSPLGEFPAWFIGGEGTTWALFVYGRGQDRRDCLRTLRVFAQLRLPSLAITYRNDPAAPASPEGLQRYGVTEWQELEGAARWAVARGAESLVLIGHSMGGAVVMSFLDRSRLARRVRGVIVDSPMLDFSATVDFGARQRRVPRVFVVPGKVLARLRFGIRWDDMDYVSRADQLTVPLLLFHGEADRIVPVKTSDALARARPDIVRYVRVAGATHLRSWNMDPERYERAVKDFLRDVASG